MEVQLEKAGRVHVPGTEMRMKALDRATSSRCAAGWVAIVFLWGVASCKERKSVVLQVGGKVSVSIRCLEGKGPIRGETKAGTLCRNCLSQQHRF